MTLPPATNTLTHALDEIKKLRRKFHLNQKELAALAGVSQSLIAKIEAGKIDPSFTRAQQIFQALEQLREKEELKAKEVMKKEVIFAEVHQPLKEIIKVMKQKGISQVPVLSRENVCGIITESTILSTLGEHPEKVKFLKAEEVMEEAPPIVSKNTGWKALLGLLQHYPIILVAEKGEVKGIISKTDVLARME